MGEDAGEIMNSTVLRDAGDSLLSANESTVTYQLPFCRTLLARLISQPENTSLTSWSNALDSDVKVQWMWVLLPMISSVGIAGNVLNLLVLTKKRISSPMRKLERSANLGLTSLAVSDLLFSLMVLPHPFVDRTQQIVLSNLRFGLYYKVYGVPAINTLLMTSTWLIVMLAVDRYIVLFYPLKAKCILGLRRTKFIIFFIFLAAGACSIPFVLHLTVQKCEGFIDERIFYEIWPRWDTSKRIVQAQGIYMRWIWPSIAVFIPQSILCFCNYRLVQGLKRAPINRKNSCPGQTIKEANNRITLTLVVIVFMALVLVTPAEVLKLTNPYARWGKIGHYVASVANLLQAVNFAFNFILYVAIDNNFRLICRNLLLGSCLGNKSLVAESEVIVLNQSSTSNRNNRLTISPDILYG